MHADCIFTDWTGFRSPLMIQWRSVFHVRDTVFFNISLDVEVADVSFEGIVHFENVSFSHVALAHGNVVSTTLNDYQLAIGFAVTYYSDDDANYDVPLEPVRPGQHGLFGEEFVIPNATMSDCLFLLASPGTVYPGCPPESVEGRKRVKARSAASDDYMYQALLDAPPGDYPDYSYDVQYQEAVYAPSGAQPQASASPAQEPSTSASDYLFDSEEYEYVGTETMWFRARFLPVDDPWLASTRRVRL